VSGEFGDHTEDLGRRQRKLPSLDAIVVSDYEKGVVTRALMDRIRTLTRNKKIRVAVDPKVKSPALYRRATLITSNQRDVEVMSGVPIEDEASLGRAGRRLLEELDCQIVLVTWGEAGMALFQRDGRGTPIPTVARTVFDVSGAGDTVISTFTLGMAAGLTPHQAAVVANVAAGIVVGEVGTVTVPAERLKAALANGAKPKGRVDAV
jgi:D-beta-D-heptose 7-phosphate kinase/D-beta-D-heptose 1-phosphate adenosyltransferase